MNEEDIYKKLWDKKTNSKDSELNDLIKNILQRLRYHKERKKSGTVQQKGIISQLVVYSPSSLKKPVIVSFSDKHGNARPVQAIAADLKRAVKEFDPDYNEIEMIFVSPRGVKRGMAESVKGHLKKLITSGFNIKLNRDIIVKPAPSIDEAKALINKNLTEAVKNEIVVSAKHIAGKLSTDQILNAAAAADPELTMKILKKYNLDKQSAAKEILETLQQKGHRLFIPLKRTKKVIQIGKDLSPEQRKRLFYTRLMINIMREDPQGRQKLERYAPLSPKIKNLIKSEFYTNKADLNKVINSVEVDFAKRKIKELRSKKSISKFLDILRKNDPRLSNDLTLLKYLQTPEGKKHARDVLEGLVKSNPNEWSEGTLRTLERNLGIPAPYAVLEKLKEKQGIEYKINRKAEINARKAVAAALYGQPGNYNQLLTRSMYKLLAQDPQFKEIAVKATKEGATEKIEEFVKQKLQSMKISYGELQAMLNTANVRKDVLERLKNVGVQIEDIPEVKETVNEIKTAEKLEKKEGIISKTVPRIELAVKKPKTKSGLLFGSTEVKFRKGGKLPLVETYVGRLSPSGIHARIANYIHSLPEREKRKIEKKLRKYKQLGYDKVLTEDELLILATTKDPVYKVRKLLQTRRMLTDEAYYEKVMSKKLKRKTEVELQATKMVKEFEKRKRALQSPFWSAWYNFSTKTKIILSFIIAASILFMPVGAFHVGGWALAVGVTALLSFVIWVFMEAWHLIAQGIVSIINLAGQTVINVINAIGKSISNFLGYTFSPMSFELVKNMKIRIGEGTGLSWGEWNLVPPSFMRLEHFMPVTFDTDPIIAKIYPPIAKLFSIIYGPIAERYVAWIKTAEWYYVGAIIGIPLVIAIVIIAYVIRRTIKAWKGVQA